MKGRAVSIDALRGLAIIGMVLSGTISRNPDLPGWLFHAQVGPPEFSFNPQQPGITWVDLVFPFFLFAMGLAFPFSLNRMMEKGHARSAIARKIILRTLKLFMFAVLLGHLSPYHYPTNLGIWRWVMGLLAFAGFFLSFCVFPQWPGRRKLLNTSGYLLLAVLVVIRVSVLNQPFSLYKHDIIILVLANMALFGALIWWLTRSNWYLRLGILGLYLGLRLSHGQEGTWQHAFWEFNFMEGLVALVPPMKEGLQALGAETVQSVFYHANYLKYLFIVLPASILGDALYQRIQQKETEDTNASDRRLHYLLMAIALLAVVINLVGLYHRWTQGNFFLNILLGGVMIYIAIRPRLRIDPLLKPIILWSVFWVILGLAFEAYEGGIRKDHATMSYFFVTAGISGYVLMAFRILFNNINRSYLFYFIQSIGKNPMVGYVAVAYAVAPVLALLQVLPFINEWHQQWSWLGVARGLLLTTLMILMTHWTVKRKLFWKT